MRNALHGGRLLTAIILLAPAFVGAQNPRETDWKPPLAEGGAPECPDHFGSRTLRSETVTNGTVKAYIIGTAVRAQKKTCDNRADLIINGRAQRIIPLPGAAGHGYSIVDFSPDGHDLLLVSNGGVTAPYWDFRNVSITVVGLAKGEVHLVNAWDAFGWKDCDAWVEPQGFTTDGRGPAFGAPTESGIPGPSRVRG